MPNKAGKLRKRLRSQYFKHHNPLSFRITKPTAVKQLLNNRLVEYTLKKTALFSRYISRHQPNNGGVHCISRRGEKNGSNSKLLFRLFKQNKGENLMPYFQYLKKETHAIVMHQAVYNAYEKNKTQ